VSKKSGDVYYKQNRLKQLRAFCTAAKTGSISKAAESLFQSQPTVTLQIQALERELDIIVFERRGRHISLTPEGAVLLQIAQPLVDGIDGLEGNFHAHFGKLDRGELNIAAGESTILYLLPDYIKRFSDAYPGIQIKLHNVTGRDGMAMLHADQADLAVGSMLEIPDDILYRPSIFYSSTLITAKGHPLSNKKRITLEDISEYGLILPPRHLATWRMLEMVFNQHGLVFNVSLEAGGWEIIKSTRWTSTCPEDPTVLSCGVVNSSARKARHSSTPSTRSSSRIASSASPPPRASARQHQSGVADDDAVAVCIEVASGREPTRFDTLWYLLVLAGLDIG
jgi:DNA-binding transcriptional LysR family regulator